MRKKSAHILWARALVLALLLAARVAGAQPVLADSDSVKAAYLVNLLRYTNWPVSGQAAGSAQLLCVLDMNALGGKLADLDGKTVAGRALEIRQVSESGSVRPCHLLFVGGAHARRLPEVVRSVKGLPVLLVSDVRDAVRNGAAIELLEADSRIRLIVNRMNAEPVGITFSAQLLRVALTVY